MAENATPSTPSAGSAPARPTIVLADPSPSDGDDFVTKEGEGSQSAAETTEGATPEQPAKKDEEKQDPDALVLELLNLRTQIQRQGKKQEQRESGLKAREDKVAGLEGILTGAKSDPMKALAAFADATGLDVDTVTNAFVALKSGGNPELPAANPLAAEVQALKDELASLKGEKQTERTQQGERDIEARHSELKQLAASRAAEFPLFNTDPESFASEAFELQFLHWEAERNGQTDPQGRPIKRITQEEAVRRIESALRDRHDRMNKALGGPTQNQPAQPGNQSVRIPNRPTPAPRAANASAAPFEPVSSIRSDEEIRADWAGFPGVA